ncbi:MAG: endonuclease III [Coxiellaceae bacterium]|nr:endonuclease III [Coxiellaceae bacterium]
MNQAKREKIFEALKKNNPNPTTELVYKTQFELLVSVILSAQATDISINKATKPLFNVANTPEKIAALGEAGLKNYIKSIGLYNSKAKNILKTCQQLIKKHQSKVPSNREDLEALPGVGRKTANVILNTAFGHDTIAVDTHIFRVSNRTKLAPGKTPLAVEKKLMKVIPKPYRHNAHHWLVLHGRYVCLARKPHCSNCPIHVYCEYEKKEPV